MTVEVLRGLARRRARGFTTLENQWELALQRLSSLGLGVDQVRKLADNCTGPTMASRLARVMRYDGPECYYNLLEQVDDSPRTLTEWLGAIDVFYRWLERQGRTTRFQHALGYICCCTQAENGRCLTETVQDMLDAYGYTGDLEQRETA